MEFRQYLETDSETQLRDFILQAAQGACEMSKNMNCRLFVQLTTKDPDIDNYPEVKDIKIGDVLVWGRQDGDYFNWGHYAIYLGKDEVLEVPGWGKPMRISKFIFPKSMSLVGYGKPTKIVRPHWDHKTI